MVFPMSFNTIDLAGIFDAGLVNMYNSWAVERREKMSKNMRDMVFIH